jgi:hypothetical protein
VRGHVVDVEPEIASGEGEGELGQGELADVLPEDHLVENSQEGEEERDVPVGYQLVQLVQERQGLGLHEDVVDPKQEECCQLVVGLAA